ncbi:hypothetical protein [Heliophilum fasciatum]|uniref:Uncharacterized protein n=1 Tax=Heliophilum fasciatum TaxID=35700 RepID=A0A4R2S081_9FIRM|nr:hypothetical protein [Heliophilum fasciatum]MCW2277760.1 hypothetical protein [Heliophilum fasciatum]TCP64745.1 hypothetical protein EDD73_10898 [Heliophilum fasciatum]
MDKYCPFMMSSAIAHQDARVITLCYDACAWYMPEQGRCAIAVIAQGIGNVAQDVAEATDAIKSEITE